MRPHVRAHTKTLRFVDAVDAGLSAPEVWDPVYNWTDRETGVTTLYNRSSEVLASA